MSGLAIVGIVAGVAVLVLLVAVIASRTETSVPRPIAGHAVDDPTLIRRAALLRTRTRRQK